MFDEVPAEQLTEEGTPGGVDVVERPHGPQPQPQRADRAFHTVGRPQLPPPPGRQVVKHRISVGQSLKKRTFSLLRVGSPHIAHHVMLRYFTGSRS
jgi:hypothetical protein